VNQSISCSFDPSNLVCVSCGNDHKIISSSPAVLVFSDQNFVPSLTDRKKNCINVTRIENATLAELFDVSKEILEHVIPEGTVMLFGSISHLARVGRSLYAADWTKLVAGLSGRWRGARICPLIPLIGTDCPGSLSREITKLSVWFSTIYEGSHLGMCDVWAGVVAAVEKFSTGAAPLGSTETYKLPLPSSLNSHSMDMTATFCSISDLLWSLLDCLCNTFHVRNNPEDYLLRDITALLAQTSPKEQKVILVGASNLGDCAEAFCQSGLEVVDLTVPRWLATPENVNKVIDQLKKLENVENCRLIIDPFGTQPSGSNSLMGVHPYRTKIMENTTWLGILQLSLSLLLKNRSIRSCLYYYSPKTHTVYLSRLCLGTCLFLAVTIHPIVQTWENRATLSCFCRASLQSETD
jgi:hypothetical protein